MTTQEEADRDALWPEGTDVSGLVAMCRGLLTYMLTGMSVYIGTSHLRGVLREIDKDDAFWSNLAHAAPVIRDQLRQSDAIGKAMDNAERKGGGGN